ncbi:Lrp/AsnC family transcriptional regulator [Amycolatopsis cihanbeyliensis]|uniref:Lrp/AsnC family transcriptional regulator n=1 Tax=Amycolatopsis cihanbeyliensis TaxID=1128664 RepID=UPI00114FCBB1|nr:Lrp/AsnC family transcriptional regulator [Amycolatopsis cihanbeyliensis]
MPTKRRRPVLDELDGLLLAELQRDSSRTLRELGEVVGLSPSAVQRRIDRYRTSGLITREVAVLDAGLSATAVLTICLVTLRYESDQHHAEVRGRLLAAPEVQQVYAVSGDYDYVVVLATAGMAEYRDAGRRLFQNAPNIQRYTTLVVFDPIKTSTALPVTIG